MTTPSTVDLRPLKAFATKFLVRGEIMDIILEQGDTIKSNDLPVMAKMILDLFDRRRS